MAELIEGPQDAEVERIVLRGVDGASVDAIHARPDGMPRLGIVLHPDIMGVRPLFDELCRRLATHGFAVCAPEPFARSSAEIRNAPDHLGRMGALPTLVDEQQLGDLEQAANYLVVHDNVTSVAMLGFCMGGMYAIKAAATGRFDRAVAFYGLLRAPGGGTDQLREPLETAGEVCPTLAIFGGRDAFTPADDIDALRAAWRDRPDCEVVVYPEADHGFVHVPDSEVHRADDAADAWRRVLDFLAG